jgi:hypothetical protein
MRRATATIVFMALVAGACGGSDKPSSRPSPPSTPIKSVSPPASLPLRATKVVYAPWPQDPAKTPQDLYVWDPATNLLTRLTKDGSTSLERVPRFVNPTTISYAIGGSLMSRPITGAAGVTLAQTSGFIAGMDWTRDGSTAVGISIDFDKNQDTLWTYTALDKKLKTVRTFPNPCGRESSFDDDSSVWWSGDTQKILLVETCLEPSVRILNADGSDATSDAGKKIAPFWGTFARFSCDGTEVLSKDYGPKATGKWFRFSLRSGNTIGPLNIQAKTYGLAVSPDGCRLAYHTGGEEPTLYVYDWMTSTERELAKSFAGPLWLSASELVAAKVDACGDVETCGDIFWEIRGNGARINTESGQQETVTLRGTNWFEGYSRQADVLFA